MKSIVKSIVFGVCILGSMINIYASTTFLFKITNNTYATSSHPNFMNADRYDGEVSVRGSDRFYTGSYTAYPTYSRITYDVQGDISSKQINSKSKTDGTTRKDSITVYDKWNFGERTQVYGAYGKGWVSNARPYKIDDIE